MRSFMPLASSWLHGGHPYTLVPPRPRAVQRGDAPVGAGSLAGCLEDGEPDEGDGGGDGQRPDVAEQRPGEPQQPDGHLHQAGHHDGPLDLQGMEERGGGGGGSVAC